MGTPTPGFPTVKKDLGNGVTSQPIFEISDNFNFLKFSDFSILNTWQGNSINSVIFAFIARGGAVTTFSSKLLSTHISFNIEFCYQYGPVLDIFQRLTHFDGPVQNIFTWLRRTEEEQAVFSPGKNCQNTGWGKSRPNSSHSAGAVLCFEACIACTDLCRQWRRVEFCNLSTYGGGSIVDPPSININNKSCPKYR